MIWHRVDGYSLVSWLSVGGKWRRSIIGYFRLFSNQFSINLNFYGWIHKMALWICLWVIFNLQKYSTVYSFPFAWTILVKKDNNLAPSGIIDTLNLAVSNLESLCAFCILENVHRQPIIVWFGYYTYSSIDCSAIMLWR